MELILHVARSCSWNKCICVKHVGVCHTIFQVAAIAQSAALACHQYMAYAVIHLAPHHTYHIPSCLDIILYAYRLMLIRHKRYNTIIVAFPGFWLVLTYLMRQSMQHS